VVDRDRDEFGNARSSRPRDDLGRPLPHGSKGVARIPDDLELSPADSLTYAQELLNRGLAFNAHEVLEAAWKNAPDDERDMWQGLAQLAVGITHVQRGNAAGATGVLARAADHLDDVSRPARHGIDVDGLIMHARALIGDLALNIEIDAERLRPRLRSQREQT
jgi:predicted metal-dependent hydrolase